MMLNLIKCAIVLMLGMHALNVGAQEVTTNYVGQADTFKLIIKGINKVEGEIRIAMFDREDSYTKDPIHAVVVPVDSTVIVWEQHDISFGEYAIAVYHDKNMNGKIDTNLLGIPKEDYGFSNNARGRFGPASWEDSKFSVNQKRFTTAIHIK